MEEMEKMEKMEKIRFNNGVVEIYVNGNLVSHATISFIRATYGEDREELAGIVRMTDLDIEYDRRDVDADDNFDADVDADYNFFDFESEVHTKVWNDLCSIEYNTIGDEDYEEPDDYYYENDEGSKDKDEDKDNKEYLTWRDEAKNDIASYTGVSEDYIEIEIE